MINLFTSLRQAQEYLPGGNIIADSPACAATVVLAVTDINDNSPTFYSGTYSGTVNENIELGHIVIATVDAFDLDQVRLLFKFTSFCVSY